MKQPSLFTETQEAENKSPLTLYADIPHLNYRRYCEGKPPKITLRSPERKNRIVATVFTGEDDAQEIVDALNEISMRKRGIYL